MKSVVALCVLSCCVLLIASAPDPCEHSGILGCEISCLVQGHLTGHCTEDNKCECSGTYYHSARKDDPCVTGKLLGCEINCLMQGFLVGKCDEDNKCQCS